MTEPSLSERVVVITGGSAGIGLATAGRLARAGARPVLLARDGARLRRAGETLQRQGLEAFPLSVDIRCPEAVSNAMDAVIQRYGRLDALVNNAGIMLGDRSLDALDPETWREVMDTNVNGAWFCTRAVLPQMRRQEAGTIINISSGAAVRTGFLNIAYGVSKAALDRMTLGLAAELDGEGIVCLSLSPPYTATDTVRALYPGRDVTTQAAHPEETARAIAGLLAGDAVRYHGRVVTVREYLGKR
ncbi:MAG: SDR family oxidoreductase [Ectothiorhodospiraceae bacterium]|nr:SDR family oxidoreductase [Ectothiorhodospiraceae bacterium]